MKKLRRTWRWVSRNVKAKVVLIWESEEKPGLTCASKHVLPFYENDASDYIAVCYEVWLATTGVKIKSGECKKVQFSREVIKEG